MWLFLVVWLCCYHASATITSPPPSCSRELSREAAASAASYVLAPAAAAGVAPSTDCALLPSRGVYAAAETTKVRVARRMWQCGVCGHRKRFRTEQHLDAHWDRTHAAAAASVDAAAAAAASAAGRTVLPRVCLADHCALLGCPTVFAAALNSSGAADVMGMGSADRAAVADAGGGAHCGDVLRTCFPSSDSGGSGDGISSSGGGDAATRLRRALTSSLCDAPTLQRALLWRERAGDAARGASAFWGAFGASALALAAWGFEKVLALDMRQPLKRRPRVRGAAEAAAAAVAEAAVAEAEATEATAEAAVAEVAEAEATEVGVDAAAEAPDATSTHRRGAAAVELRLKPQPATDTAHATTTSVEKNKND